MTPAQVGSMKDPLTLSNDGTTAPGNQESEIEEGDDDDGGSKPEGRMSRPILKAFMKAFNKEKVGKRVNPLYECHLCDKVSYCN